MKRNIPASATTAFLLAMHTGVDAGTVYRWTDSSGQAHFSDRPPGEQATLARQVSGNNPPGAGSPGLRPGERRVLEQLDRQADARREARAAYRSAVLQRRLEQRQACLELRERLRGSREHAQRKHYAGQLRRNCW